MWCSSKTRHIPQNAIVRHDSIIYLFNSALAKKFKKVDPKIALLYVSSVAIIGVFGEVFVDSFYNLIFKTPLWQYQILPIHNSYTSYYSVVIWGMYGFYLYLLHDHLSGYNIQKSRTLALIVSIEAIVLEILFNFSHLAIFKRYIFYYTPGDLWHLTSLLAIPFYFLAGLAIVKSIKRFKADPSFFIVMNALLVLTLVFLAR